MNRAAFLALASTASGGFGLLAIAWLATGRLSAAELGFFFSFLSLGTLVQLADFGLSYASLQSAGRLVGSGRAAELPALAARARYWTITAASAAAAIVGALGWAIFSARKSGAAASGVDWQGPWVGYVAGAFALQLTTPGIFLREGSGKISQMWRLRLVQWWVAIAACVGALQSGAGLWSLAVFVASRAAVGALWLWVGDPIRRSNDVPAYTLSRWMTEIWPFQWKIGLSTLSGFFIFWSFSPIILLEKGPVLAGQFGLAISVMNMLIAISTAWPMSQSARYSASLAAGRLVELRREFPVMFWESTALATAGAALTALVLWWLRRRGFIFAMRLTDPATTAILLATAVVYHAVTCAAMFLRAEGREPMLLPSVLGAPLTVLAIWVAAHFGSGKDIAIAYFVLAVGGIPISFLLLRSRMRHLLRMSDASAFSATTHE